MFQSYFPCNFGYFRLWIPCRLRGGSPHNNRLPENNFNLLKEKFKYLL